MNHEPTTLRLLQRDEVEAFWKVDRRETHHNVYRMREGALVLTPRYFEHPGWPAEPPAEDTALLYACYDRGGAFIGAFDGERIVGIAIVDTVPFGPQKDRLELKKLYVSHDYRGKGLGARLFEEASAFARARGAACLYISATPTENTVNFYLRRGSQLATPPDPERLALEPEDIHLVCAIGENSLKSG